MSRSIIDPPNAWAQTRTREPSLRPQGAPTGGKVEALDMVHLWTTVRENSKVVLAVAIGVFALVMTATLVSRMDFRSVGRLYLGELDDAKAPAATGELDLSGGGQGAIGSEIEILNSRSLISRAILESGLNVTIQPAGHSTPRYGQWLVSGRDPSSLDVAAREVRAVKTSLPSRASKDRTYGLRFVTTTEYEVWSGESRLGRGKLDEALKVDGLELTLVRGSERTPPPQAEYEMTVRPLEGVTDYVLKNLKVATPKATAPGQSANVVVLEFTHQSPRLSAAFLEQLMQVYLRERQAWKVEDAAAAEAFVTRQLEAIRASLDAIQKKLADYRTKNRVVVLDNEAKAMIEQIGKYEEQRVAARLQAAALADIQRTLRGPKPPIGAYLMGEANDSVLEGMAASLSEARQKLTDLETRFSDAAPEVKEQRAQVDAQLEAIRNYVSSRAARAQENLGALSRIISQFEEKLKTVPGAELGLAQLSRESEVYSKTYSNLLERQQQTALIKASTLSKNRVLDLPEVPLREDSPRLTLSFLSGLLGLGLGVVLVILRSVLARTFQTAGDVRRSLGTAPVLAVVPAAPWATVAQPELEPDEATEALAADPNSSLVESLRMLRNHIYRDPTNHVALITSPAAGDGKTTTALGLASVLAADGKKVLVVGANFRGSNEQLHGLRGVLMGECNWRVAVRAIRPPSGHFYVLPPGGDAAPELLSSDSMRRLLTDVRGSFDYVLIDGATFPEFSDALVLASLVDLVLTVVRLQNSARKLASEHVQSLEPVAQRYALVVNGSPVAPRRRRKAPKPVARKRRQTLILELEPEVRPSELRPTVELDPRRARAAGDRE